MSLLDQLSKARHKLKSVEIEKTLEDGRSVIERRTEDGSFVTVEDEQEGIASEEGSGPSFEGVCSRRMKKVTRLRRCGFVVDLKPDMQCAQVTPSLFLGSQDVAADLPTLKKNGITHVVNCATGIRSFFPTHFKYNEPKLLDHPSQDIKEALGPILQFMDSAIESGGKVFVHCNAGISRASTIVIAYLIWFHRIPLDESLMKVKQVRPVIRPNDGFLRQLKELEEETLGKT